MGRAPHATVGHATTAKCQLGPDTATLEHIVPRSLGGSNQLLNLVLACRDCNHGRAAGNAEHPACEFCAQARTTPRASRPTPSIGKTPGRAGPAWADEDFDRWQRQLLELTSALHEW